MDSQKAIAFIQELSGKSGAIELFDEREQTKKDALEKLFSEELTSKVKEEIRTGLTFRLKGRSGLGGLKDSLMGDGPKKSFAGKDSDETAMDTFESLNKGERIRPEDNKRVHDAMAKLLGLIEKAKDATGRDGQPLFGSAAEIEAELFTPLVREGVIPENLVADEYSEVQQLLNGAFKSYQDGMRDKRDADAKASAKSRINADGGGSGFQKLTGGASTLLELVVNGVDDRIVGKFSAMLPNEHSKKLRHKFVNGLAETISEGVTLARAGIAFNIVTNVVSNVAPLMVNLVGWIPGSDGSFSAIEAADRQLNPEDHLDELSEEQRAELGDDPDADDVSRALTVARYEAKVSDVLEQLGPFVVGLGLDKGALTEVSNAVNKSLELLKEDPTFYTVDGVMMGFDAAISAVKGVLLAKEAYSKYIDQFGVATNEVEIACTLAKVMKASFGAMDAALQQFKQPAAVPLLGSLARKIDGAALQAAAVPVPSGTQMVQLFAEALTETFVAATPRNAGDVRGVFEAAGTSVANEFRRQLSSKDVDVALKDDKRRAEAPAMFAAAITAAVRNGITSELMDLWKDPAIARGVAAKAVFEDDLQLLEQIERSEENIKQFERDLVLIDEAGELAADPKKIDKMIRQLQRDQMLIKAASLACGALSSVTSGAMGVVATATEAVTMTVFGEVVGPLKAAMMTLQLGLSIKQAIERISLANSLSQGLKAARKAGSPLQSAIQGLLNNKEHQIAYHAIDDALTAIQIATTIVGSVPNEYAMAIGKTATLAAKTAQATWQIAEQVYSEIKLSAAWKVTIKALENPGDRNLGMETLKLNPTLGMHAIAWAAMEKQPADPIARNVLKKLGLTEKTLAASGTETKVRKYLLTLLHEDLALSDHETLGVKWAPKKVVLSARDWFSTVARGAREAVPKLRTGDDSNVVAGLKLTDMHDLKRLSSKEPLSRVGRDEWERWREESMNLVKALSSYPCKNVDGQPHEEMNRVRDQFAALAAAHLREINDHEPDVGSEA